MVGGFVSSVVAAMDVSEGRKIRDGGGKEVLGAGAFGHSGKR